MFPEAATYLRRLQTHLELEESDKQDIVRELHDHIEDRVEALLRHGVSERRAQRIVLEGLGRPRSFAHLIGQAHLVTGWRDAIVGALPAVLVALLFGTHLWQTPLLALAAGALVFAVTVYGLWLDRPGWFYPWAGVALSLMLLVGYLDYTVLGREFPRLLDGDFNLWTLFAVAGCTLYFPVASGLAVSAVLVAVRRDWLDASILLSPMPGVLVWIISLDHVDGAANTYAAMSGTSFLLGAIYVIMAFAIVAYLRASSRSRRMFILIASSLLLTSFGTIVDSHLGLTPLVLRSAILLAFLLSPALVTRRA
jgi:hypothetical protein